MEPLSDALVYGTCWRLCLRGKGWFPTSAYYIALWVRVMNYKEMETSMALIFCEGFMWQFFFFVGLVHEKE